jgi:iron complex outermembrane receptor protein
VTVYNLEMQKEILASNINNQGTFQNANGTRHTGVEAGGGMVLTKGLFAQGGAGQGGQPADACGVHLVAVQVYRRCARRRRSAGPNVLIAKDGNTVAGAPEHSS